MDLSELAGDAEGRYASSGDPTRGTKSVGSTESATTGARWLKHDDNSDGYDEASVSPPRRSTASGRRQQEDSDTDNGDVLSTGKLPSLVPERRLQQRSRANERTQRNDEARHRRRERGSRSGRHVSSPDDSDDQELQLTLATDATVSNCAILTAPQISKLSGRISRTVVRTTDGKKLTS